MSLVIATITGGARAQTWENVGRRWRWRKLLVDEGGAVAICSNLRSRRGNRWAGSSAAPILRRRHRKISHDHDADSWPAWQLARALQRGPVYFLSQLDAETVEDLGLAPVGSVDELVRLAGRHESFVVVEDSQHAVVTVDGEKR